MDDKRVKVAGMRIKNFQNIEFVDLQFDEHLNIIAGMNGAGKSTLCEGIFYAIIGKPMMGAHPESLIKKGEEKAEITLKLKEGDVDFIVERSINQAGNVYVKGKRPDGGPVTQEYLKSLLSDFTIDPLAFMKLKPKEQIEMVKRLANIDTTALDEQYKKLYDERTFINRTVKEKETLLNDTPKVEQVERKSIDDLIAQRDAIIENNHKAEQEGTTKNTLVRQAVQLETHRDALKKKKEELLKMVADLDTQIESADKQITSKKDEINKLGEAKYTIQSTDEIDAQISSIEAHNKKVDELDKYNALRNDLKTRLGKQSDIEKQMTAINDEKAKLVAGANLPMKDLEFDDETGLIIEGIPFSQKSSAQQLEIASELATIVNPALKVIYIKDGSLLDKNTLASIKDLAERKDYMILVEMVGENVDEKAIIMRAGEMVQ